MHVCWSAQHMQAPVLHKYASNTSHTEGFDERSYLHPLGPLAAFEHQQLTAAGNLAAGELDALQLGQALEKAQGRRLFCITQQTKHR